MALLSRARRNTTDIQCTVVVCVRVCGEQEGAVLSVCKCASECVCVCVCVCACVPLCLHMIFYAFHANPREKGQTAAEWLAGSKMRDFIYSAVNVSVIAAGFLGLNSLTGHLISHSLT